ncbi:2155_t:CDS:2 [Paraglomus occultum]|uniref:2155_t:CDS:1 n=1 Tax=Paraglomus occultum TaxID=144539 RepID=A0A9N9B644_9GLOM|nr:2155_t:CDS:2 [Paraglomus occultum]
MALVNGFALTCKNMTDSDTGKVKERCACDFRINIFGCPESNALIILYYVLLVVTIIHGIVSGYFLYHGVVRRRMNVFFPPTRDRGVLRPKPQDAFHIMVVIFSIMQIGYISVLLSNGWANTRGAELGHNLPRVVAFGLAGMLPISIAYSTPATSNETSLWAPSKTILDVLGFFQIIGPALTQLPLSWTTGTFADKGDVLNARRFFEIQYMVVGIWSGLYTGIVWIVWYNLKKILNEHHQILRERVISDNKWKLMMLKRVEGKLTTVSMAFTQISFVYIFASFIGEFFHENLIFIRAVYFLCFAVWNFTMPVAFAITQGVFIYCILRPVPKLPTHISSSFRPMAAECWLQLAIIQWRIWKDARWDEGTSSEGEQCVNEKEQSDG